MYRVIIGLKTYAFDDYSKAKQFKNTYGGTLYERVYPKK